MKAIQKETKYVEWLNPDVMHKTSKNWLSDLLFVLARFENKEKGDVLWVPGANR